MKLSSVGHLQAEPGILVISSQSYSMSSDADIYRSGSSMHGSLDHSRGCPVSLRPGHVACKSLQVTGHAVC